MLTMLFVLNFLLMIALPLVVGNWLSQRYRPGWGLFGMGAATFVLSQVGHLPFNWLVLQQWSLLPNELSQWGNLLVYSLFLGLSAGLFEEVARYLTYRFWAKEARTWRQGMMLGAGHGGIEALLVGLLGLVNFLAVLAMSRGMLLSLAPADSLPLIEAQIEQVFSTPPWMVPLGFMERVFAVLFHLAASLMVMQVFVRKQLRWLLAAILLHTVFNTTAVVLVVRTNPYITEAGLALLTVISIFVILRLREATPSAAAGVAPKPVAQLDVKKVTLTAESLDNSRFTEDGQ